MDKSYKIAFIIYVIIALSIISAGLYAYFYSIEDQIQEVEEAAQEAGLGSAYTSIDGHPFRNVGIFYITMGVFMLIIGVISYKKKKSEIFKPVRSEQKGERSEGSAEERKGGS